MSRDRPFDRLVIWVCSLAVLVGSGVLLGFTLRDVVRHVRADDQPATITDISGPGSRISNNDRRRARSFSFRLDDGTEHAAAAEGRWFWQPNEGDTIHVFETSPNDWQISEAFSWVRTLVYTAMFLLPWIFALLKVWEWVERTAWPERWEAKQRAERARRRLARKDQKD